MLLVGFVGSYSASGVTSRQEHGVELLWENVASIFLDMKFSNGIITSTGTVTGKSGTTAISATFILERRNTNGTFTEVDRWTANHGSITMLLSTSRSTRNQSAGTYRLSVIATVTRNGKLETVTGNHTTTFQ